MILIVLCIATIAAPHVLGENLNCTTMPQQMFGIAEPISPKGKTKDMSFVVDLKRQKIKFWPLYSKSPSEGFQFYDYQNNTAYFMQKNGTCRMETIDSRLSLPVINPAFDFQVKCYGDQRFCDYKKAGVGILTVDTWKCYPEEGSFVQVQWGKPITHRWTVTDTYLPYDHLNPDITSCTY